jgi:uncharacterized protein YwqG
MKEPQSQSIRDVVALTRRFHRPAIQLRATAYRIGATSYFGGAPPLVDGFEWPASEERPLMFLACIDLSELARVPDLNWLPTTGRLLFFYDILEQPWGFDPVHRAGWRVVYAEESELLQDEAPTPEEIEFDGLEKKRGIAFHVIELPPPWESDEIASLQLSDAEIYRFIEYRTKLYGDRPHHQISGFADPEQGPHMQLECQLTFHGLYCGDSTGYQDQQEAELAKRASDWQLLLQVDSNDDLGVMWGDVGKIYFWIRRQDAKKKQFDNAWLILQCS